MNRFLFVVALLFGIHSSAKMNLNDVHMHSMSPQLAQLAGQVRPEMKIRPVSGQELVETMNAHSVQRSALISSAYLVPKQLGGMDPKFLKQLVMMENNWASNETQTYGNRFVGFCGVALEWDYALEEARRCLELPGMNGIKLHLQYHDTDLHLHKDRLDQLFSLGKTLLIHLPLSERGFTWDIFNHSIKHPDTNVIWAHALSQDFRDLERYISFYKNWPYAPRNIYLDLSMTLSFYKGSPASKELEWILKEWGTDYLLFGSDYSFTEEHEETENYNHKIQSVKTYFDDDNSLEAVLSGNFDRLFK